MPSKSKAIVAVGLGAVVLAAVIGWFSFRDRAARQTTRVGVFLYAQQPIIKEIYAGFRQQLDKEAAATGRTIEYVERNADGEAAQTTAIAGYFRSADVDAIFVVGQPAAQALKSAAVQRPVVFAGPPDPVGAGLVPRLASHGTNFTGAKYFPNVDAILGVFKDAYPQASRLAVLHNPGEANSMAVTRAFLEGAQRRDFTVRDMGASNGTELEANLRALYIDRVDALFLPNDTLVYSSLDRVMAQAKSLELPVFSCTKLSVEKGAAFAIATDYSRLGELAASMAARIVIGGEHVQAIDVLDVQEGHLYVKKDAAVAGRIKTIPGYDVVSVP